MNLSFLNRIKLFRKRRANAAAGRVRASFDAAQTTADNARHWSAADGLSADEEARPEVRRILRRRVRYEVLNNSYATGLVQMLANDTISTGPRVQLLTSSEVFNDKVERSFRHWAQEVKLAQKLYLMRMARCQDGETFAVMNNNPKLRHEVKLDLTVIEADRIEGEAGFNVADETVEVDGIRFDKWGNPVSYRVLRHHPGDSAFSYVDEAISVPAAQMIHMFRQVRPGLHRGIPELTAALGLFAQLRRYNLAVLSAAEAAADFAAILYTDAPPNGETDEVEPLDEVELRRNMMLTVPAGWKLGQLEPKQPANKHAEFVKVILSEIARCVCATYGSVAGDFSGFNYSSGRLDNQIYQKSVLVDRSHWEATVLNRVFTAWLREYCLIHKVRYRDDFDFEWFWDGFLHVDPSKDAKAQSMKLASNTTTLAAEFAAQGKDWRQELDQRAKEIAKMRELGIPFEEKPSLLSAEDEREPNDEIYRDRLERDADA